MLALSPTSNYVRRTLLVRFLGICALVGLVSWGALLFAPQALAAPRAPEAPKIAQPASLGLSGFGAKVTRRGVVILHWETGTEMTIFGFNVWKRVGKGAWQKLNAAMIPAKSTGQVVGNEYLLRDKHVQAGKAYSYKLEVVSTEGYSAYTEVVKVKIKP